MFVIQKGREGAFLCLNAEKGGEKAACVIQGEEGHSALTKKGRLALKT